MSGHAPHVCTEGDSGLAAAGLRLRRTLMVSGAESSAPASAEPATPGGACCGSTGALISPKL